jgi:hypothetical protein
MLTMIGAVALLALSAEPQPTHPWGILGLRGNQPVVYSSSRLPDGMHIEAYQLGKWTKHIALRVTSGALNERSRLYDGNGASASWEHAVASEVRMKEPALWICLPPGLTLTGAGEDAAILRKAGRKVGRVRISRQSEGISVVMTVGGVSEKVYYYLGYDLQ